MISKLLAQVGTVQNPFGVMGGPAEYANSACGSGLFVIFANLIKLLIVIAGLYAFFNFILAGYSFLSAGGEPKAITKAWEKIWQSILGLTVVAGSFILAGIVGWLIFRNTTALITPRIYYPGSVVGCYTYPTSFPSCAGTGGTCTSTQQICAANYGGSCHTGYNCTTNGGGCCCY